MKKLLHLKLMAVLLALTFGFSYSWAAQETVTISYTDFATGSYAKGDGNHSKNSNLNRAFNYTTKDIYQNSSAMQWRRGTACKFHNTNSLGFIDKIEITKKGTMNYALIVKECATSDGDFKEIQAETSGSVCTYTFSGVTEYFTITNGSNASYCDNIIVYYKELTSDPTITAPESIVFGDAYNFDGVTETLRVSGQNLTEAISYAWQTGGMFTATGNLTTNGGQLSISLATTEPGTYNDVLTLSSTGAEDVTVAVSATLKAIPGEGEGTLESPYDVARAKAMYDINGKDIADAYVKGTISNVGTYSYGKLTYDLEGGFQVYKGLSFEGDNFSAATDLSEGDFVIVKGTITYYSRNTLYEFAEGSTLVKRITTPEFTIADAEDYEGAVITPQITTTNTDEYTVTYSSSAPAIVSVNGATLKAEAEGTATITATMAETANFFEASTTFTVTVKPISSKPTLITIGGELTNKVYTYGDALDYTGLTVATNLGGDVTEFTTFTNSIGETLNTLGEAVAVTITANYADLTTTTTATITVNDELTGLTLSGTYPTEFVIDTPFNHEGLVATATYLSGAEKDVTADVTFSEVDMTVAGTKTVKVSYSEGEVTKTATYSITISDPYIFTIPGEQGWLTFFGLTSDVTSAAANSLDVTGVYNNVTLNVKNGNKANAWIKKDDLRFYSGGYTVTFTVPEDYDIVSITANANKLDIKGNGTNVVTFSPTSNIKEITYIDVKVAPVVQSGNLFIHKVAAPATIAENHVYYNGENYVAGEITLTDAAGYSFDNEITCEYIQYKRTGANLANWNAVCLPFAVPSTDLNKLSVLEFVGEDLANGAVVFEYITEGADMEAGKPYIVKAKADDAAINFLEEGTIIAASAVQTSTANNVEFIGTFATTTSGEMGAGAYAIKDGVFTSAKAGHSNVTLLPFRAYLKANSGMQNLKVRAGVGTTGIEDITVADDAEGMIFYNINGQRVDNPTKGMYITNNGVKVIIK